MARVKANCNHNRANRALDCYWHALEQKKIHTLWALFSPVSATFTTLYWRLGMCWKENWSLGKGRSNSVTLPWADNFTFWQGFHRVLTSGGSLAIALSQRIAQLPWLRFVAAMFVKRTKWLSAPWKSRQFASLFPPLQIACSLLGCEIGFHSLLVLQKQHIGPDPKQPEINRRTPQDFEFRPQRHMPCIYN